MTSQRSVTRRSNLDLVECQTQKLKRKSKSRQTNDSCHSRSRFKLDGEPRQQLTSRGYQSNLRNSHRLLAESTVSQTKSNSRTEERISRVNKRSRPMLPPSKQRPLNQHLKSSQKKHQFLSPQDQKMQVRQLNQGPLDESLPNTERSNADNRILTASSNRDGFSLVYKSPSMPSLNVSAKNNGYDTNYVSSYHRTDSHPFSKLPINYQNSSQLQNMRIQYSYIQEEPESQLTTQKTDESEKKGRSNNKRFPSGGAFEGTTTKADPDTKTSQSIHSQFPSIFSNMK